MRIFNLQGLGAPDKPKIKKKNKYAEIDFTSHHSFLRLRKLKKINLKLSHTKKTQPSVHRLFQGFRQGASWSVEVQFVNFIWWVAFVLFGVLSDRSDTTCQIGGIFVRIDSMSFLGSAGQSLGTNILHFGY
jgi:hypothetical protein